MLKMIGCELKRLLLTKAVVIGITLAIVSSLGFSFLVISFEHYYYMDDTGNMAEITGREAIKAKLENRGRLDGVLTAEKISNAYDHYMMVCNRYKGTIDDVPRDVYYEELYAYELDLEGLLYIFMNNDTGYYVSNLDLSEDSFTNYYRYREQFVEDYVQRRYGQNAVNKVQSMLSNTNTPFVNKYGINSDVVEYIGLLQWLLVLISIVIIVPGFAMGYQSQADDIFRCSKFGRKKLALSKIISSLLLTVPLYLICMAIYLLIVGSAFQWNGLENSVQMLLQVISIAPLNLGETLIFLLVSGLIALVSSVVFSLFVSASVKTTTNGLIIALGVFFLPTFVAIISNSNIANWIKSITPSSPVGLLSGVFNEACATISFLKIGSYGIWTTNVILFCSVIYIPIFIFLAIRKYCRYER